MLRSSYQNSYSYLVLVPGTKYEYEYEQKFWAGTKYEYEYEAKKSEKYEVRGLSTSSYFSYLVLIGKSKEICLFSYNFSCMVGGRVFAYGLPKFSKFSPAAQKNARKLLHGFQNFWKFPPAAQKMEIWLKDIRNSQNFCLRRRKGFEIKRDIRI